MRCLLRLLVLATFMAFCSAAPSITIAQDVSQDDVATPDPYEGNEYQAWFKRQKLNPSVKARFGVGWDDCCGNADRIKVKPVHLPRSDEWWFEDPQDGQWKIIPLDTIHEEYDPTMPKQLRVEGVLMVYRGNHQVACVWLPEGGG